MFKRLPIDLKPNNRRVICFPYYSQDEKEKRQTIERIYNNIIALDKELVQETYDAVIDEFSGRHKTFFKILNDTFIHIKKYLPENASDLPDIKKELLASFFLKEYSVEAAALFNPSMVIHPIQDSEDKIKILISLRATGEQHISSIEFAEGYICKNNEIELMERSTQCRLPQINTIDIEKSVLDFNDDVTIAEQVIFPLTPDESNGIEDVRFVRFEEENGEITYYGTFTAFDGKNIKSKLICTPDFKKYIIRSLSGSAIKDKGMALFPKKISGQYAMISRQDGENIRIMFSDDLIHWDKSEVLQVPVYPWQFAKIGNCGSPIETDKGWLLLTHGVGAIRKYTMGALLLDKQNPRKVLAQTKVPILSAKDKEREGYVPNVVYSCGGIQIGKKLFIPFAVSDISSSVVSVEVEELISMMEKY